MNLEGVQLQQVGEDRQNICGYKVIRVGQGRSYTVKGKRAILRLIT